MIYIFDKKQAIIKVLTNDDFTAAHLNFKINTATTLEFSLPASKALPSGSKYVATPHPLNDSKFIMLRLTERVDNTETIDYSAYELAYQELATDGYIEDKRPQNQSALNLMKIALDGSNWELNNVNVSGTVTTNFYYVDRLSAISKVVDLLGGEIVFYIEIQGNAISGRYMDYLARQGADTSKVFASGSNLLTVERQSDTSNIYTAILPRGKGKEIDNGDADTPDGYGRRINIADVEWKKSEGKTLDKPKGSIVLSDPDATAEWGQINGNARLLLKTYDDIDDVNVLINSAYKTLQSVNHPQIQYSATVADVGGLSLGDTVLIMHGDRDLSYKTRVFEVKYDLLSPDQTELSLGDDLSSNSITSQINNLNAVADTTSSQTQWTINQIGRPSTTFGNTEPTNPKVGDVFFKELPDGGTEIYRWNGDIWELLASPTTADDIADAVDGAVTQAKAYSDQLVATNREQVDAVLDDVQAKQADLTAQQAELDTKAQGYANKALADAKANTLATATQTAKDASDALVKAKTDLTTSLNKEVTDRTKAVSDLDTKAQGYATQAKTDAIATANGAVAKEVTDRQKAITDLDAKSTGAINQAKTDAQSALDALQVGTRNLFLNSKTLWNVSSNGGTVTKEAFDATTNMWHITSPLGSGDNRGLYFNIANNTSTPIPVGQPWTMSFDIKGTGLFRQLGPEGSTTKGLTGNVPTDWTRVSATGIRTTANNVVIYFDATTVALDVYIKLPKLEQGTKATDYTQAPEDIVLDYTTKDNIISQSLTQYQATNDGKVTKAQSDATQALGLVATKVSQTDYNTKTGDLDSKYTAVKQTADQASTDIVAIKSTNTSQDTKINTLTSDVSGTKQSISDIQTEQGKQSTKINTIQTDVSGTKQDISDIKDANGVQDGKIASISTTVDGLSSSFSTYKTTNDGKVAKAQADITANATAISQKVSQTAYDTKTGQLQTDLTAVTTTANGNKTDIVAIKKTDTDQDARMTTIESDANGVKTTVSSLQTTANTQAGSISTLQQRADGFDATVTKVNNLSVGGRNLYLNSRVLADGYGTNGSVTVTVEPFDSTTNMWHIVAAQSTDKVVGIYIFEYGKGKIPDNSDWSYSADIKGTGKVIQFGIENSTKSPIKGNIGSNWSRTSQTGHINEPPYKNIIMYFDTMDSPLDVYIKLPKLETGNLPTDWTPAPEDVDSATAKAQLTADKASLDLSKYQTDADGRISKAQADIIVNANAITQKVSQSDYNAKTGDLTTKVNTAQITADSATSTIGAYKTANDARVASAESNITANATAITSKVSQSDYNTKTGQIDGQISTINQTAGKISQTVSDVKAQVDGLSVGGRNLYLNSRAVADNYGGAGTITVEPFDSTTNMWHVVSPQGQGIVGIYLWDYGNGKIPDNSDWAFSADVKGTSTPSAFGIESGGHNPVVGTVGSEWSRISQTGYIDNNLKTIVMYFDTTNTPLDVYIKLPKLEVGNLPTDWTPAPEDTDNKISTVSQTVDSINSIVSDPTTGLTKRIQTAEGSISTVQSNVSDLQSKQTQTANGLTTEISNRATGDTNNLTQAKDFTTSSISNSESGMRSLITQTSDSIMAKVDTKTDSATVLSLLKDNWSIGIADNAGALASGIAGDLNGMTLISKKITLDGDTTVTGDFYAKGGNFKNLNASNLTVGTLNGNQVNITNINANNIVSGAISGANLNINLNTGSVVFQKGRINSFDYTTDINIDQGYISTANDDTRAILKNGQLQLTSPNYYDLQTNPYLAIYNSPRAFDSTGKFNSAVISARDRVIIGNKDGLDDMFWFGDTFYFGQSNFYGLSSGTTIGNKIPTTVGGGKTGVVLVGGSTYTNVIGGNDSPSITVGWSPDNIYSGNRVMIQGDRVHIPSIYNRTWSTSSNVYVAADGSLYRASSARKYKLDIKNDISIADSLKLIEVPLSTWVDKHEHEENGSNERYFGMIAEDLRDAGLEYLVQYGKDNEVEGINYDRVALLLIPLVKELKERIEELESKGK